ncbi:helix-turn-helix domain-containing protein [Actinospica durhamensis]|uniref:Helix-turn-helix domain-containing protein n=1 Tax=Actinospica durhamensis TaxID=1508375 RepID=A0A941EWF8_9ACTN|nr:LuxR family transcriptional regulator [Actinospica durhamensis]MBR7837678.1 helix-turn-helix domain-containing protein [Actinospica durhamensis]
MLSGRDGELRSLRGLLYDARAGRGGALTLVGEAGIGKSALLDALAREDGVRVLRATGFEPESGLAYAGLHLLLHPVLGRLAALPGPQREALKAAFGLGPAEASAAGDRLLIGLAVLTLLSDLAGAEDGTDAETGGTAGEAGEAGPPVLCLVDDAHWLDKPSLEALVFAARRLGAERVAVVFAGRPGCAALEQSGLAELAVRGLAQDAAEELLGQRRRDAGALPDAARARILAQAQGNPLALLELPAQDGTPRPGFEILGDALLPELPQRLMEAFRTQVEALPAQSLALVQLAAAADGLGLEVLLRAAPRFGTAPDAIGPAERAGILQVSQRTFTFRHPLLRTAVASTTPVPLRLAAHRALAASLDGPEDADLRIWHESAAATEPDERLAAELERTAERAASRGGRQAAVAAYERAARLSPDAGARLRRWVSAAEAAVEHGDGERAQECARLAETVLAESAESGGGPRKQSGVADAGLRARLVLARAAAKFELGDLRAAYQIAYSGAQELGRVGDVREAAWLLCQTVDVAWYLGDREVESYSALFMTFSALPAEDPARTVGLFVESALLLSLREPLDFLPYRLGDAVAKTRIAGLDDAPVMLTLGALAPILGQDEEALELFADVLADVREHARIAWVSPTLGALGRILAHLGRLPEARNAALEASALAEAAGQPQWQSQVSGLLAYLAAAAGEEEACRGYARQAMTDLAPTVMSLGESWGRWALGLLDLGLGRPAAALEHLRVLENGPAVHQLAATRALPDLLEAAVRTGDRALAERTQDRLVRWAGSIKQDAADALVLRGEALLAEDDPATALGAFAAAVRLYERRDFPFDRARTQLLWGERLRRERRRTEARVPLNAALETFEQIGATPWAERARQELAASGGPAPAAGATVVTPTNGPAAAALAALTSQEAQIVRLAAQGLSNRDIAAQLILSPRTVGHHLYKAYPKLGVLSRGELPALLGTA